MINCKPLLLLFIATASTSFYCVCKSQIKLDNEAIPERLTPKEFTIPVSPLFDLLGAAPAQVAKTADIKDFKVDWSFRNWRINPNLAIQAQPLWEIFYNRKKIDKYQQANRFQRMMASLDVSVGTLQGEGETRRIGGAVKINLYRQKDPLLVKGVYDEVQNAFDEELVLLKEKEKELLASLDTLLKPSEIKTVREAIRENDGKLTSYYGRRNTAIQEKAATFISDNWNSAYIDAAFGKVYTYSTDSAGTLKKLSLNRNTGNGGWINFGFGLGKRSLISGLLRTTFYEEEISFFIKDKITGEEINETAIAGNNLISLGINYRYGGPLYNFFAEVLWEGKKSRTPFGALQSVFEAPDGKEIVVSTVKWDTVNPYTINLGGDWRISRNVILNYGIRWVMDEKFKTISFTPIASISCMMR
jgi:hypothetical protein